MRWLRIVLGSIACLVWNGLANAGPLPPSPSPRYVHDDARWLGADAYSSLDLKLEWFERDTSSQVVVGIFKKLPEGEELFDFSQRLFGAWMPGQKGKDNGVLLLIFDTDRKIRIHTGYGMEGALPDARAAQIIGDVMVPRVRAGDREGAVEAGVDAILASVKGEYTGDGTTRVGHEPEEDLGGWLFGAVIVFILLGLRFPILFRVAEVVFSGAGSASSSRGGSSGGGFSGGGGRSGGGGASGGW
jgi:uncharacterized protein